MDADYVVVGAGSAGCVVASRLSETGASVVLLEAGPRDTLPWIHIPAGMLKLALPSSGELKSIALKAPLWERRPPYPLAKRQDARRIESR